MILSNSFSTCVTLIIPSSFEDFMRCYVNLKRSICDSVRYPEEIVLVISGVLVPVVNITILLKKIKKCTNKLSIIIRKRKHNAASNRNVGYFHSHCSILSFFDIDDIMSIYRIYIIHKIFAENKNIDIVFHPSTKNYYSLDVKNLINLYKKYAVTNQCDIIRNRCRNTYIFDGRIFKCDVSNKFYITNGWPSIKRKIMKKVHFNESLSSTEDLDFISRIVAKGYNVALFKKPLGFYIKDFNCMPF